MLVERKRISACLLVSFLYKSDFLFSPKKEIVISTSHVSGGQVSVWLVAWAAAHQPRAAPGHSRGPLAPMAGRQHCPHLCPEGWT